jgi:aspartate kinase
MSIVVMKFGGTSVADSERIKRAARRIVAKREEGYRVVAVLSARGKTTDELIAMAEEVSPEPHPREMDMLLSTGERISCALCAMAINDLGFEALSLTGSQAGIVTDTSHTKARIIDVRADRITAALDDGKIVLVAGFQGVSTSHDVTTLGRGGSDTSAVALAAAISADRCDIYTDVDGVYTSDPRIVPKARRLAKVAFEEMLEMASLGAKVLQVRSVELAMVNKVRLYVRSSFDDPAHPQLGTLICDEEEIMEQEVVTGIAFSRDEAQITLRDVADKPGVAAAIFVPLADANINVDMIIQVVSGDATTTDITFTVPATEYERAIKLIKQRQAKIGYAKLHGAQDVVKISAIGVGMRSHSGVAARAFKALAEKGVNIRAITTSEIKFSMLIDDAYTELAVRTLHTLYGLDAK